MYIDGCCWYAEQIHYSKSPIPKVKKKKSREKKTSAKSAAGVYIFATAIQSTILIGLETESEIK